VAVMADDFDYREELAGIIRWVDDYLDSTVADAYKDQPLAQDWARVAKVTEEAGEAVDALIGFTGQNPRKGTYGTEADLLDELADVALTGLYALQHFMKNNRHVDPLEYLIDRARRHQRRIENPDG
jgi:NTP pyrophosphatase (non-canonical NTP hydrolase)